MAFIDELKFHAMAGNGGMGVVRWRHEKNKEYSGAAGGNGGKGGDVFVRAVRDISVMSRHKSVKEFKASKGGDGMNMSMHGKDGEDFTIDLPIGSIITNEESGRVVELLEDGQVEKILHGGRGGLGNEYFKASTNVRPEQSTDGALGEDANFTVELDMIADIGLIGLPNAGKSSLLNSLTNAKAKIGSYAFTTLDPNLGVLHGGYVMADIPGIIEGAAEGKGLGHKFLRHVKRTKLLLHLLSLELVNKNDTSQIIETYKVIRKELEKFGGGLEDKPEIIILTKTDVCDLDTIKLATKALRPMNKDILSVSILDDKSVKILGDELSKRLNKI